MGFGTSKKLKYGLYNKFHFVKFTWPKINDAGSFLVSRALTRLSVSGRRAERAARALAHQDQPQVPNQVGMRAVPLTPWVNCPVRAASSLKRSECFFLL
jgi:hypothetical protein